MLINAHVSSRGYESISFVQLYLKECDCNNQLCVSVHLCVSVRVQYDIWMEREGCEGQDYNVYMDQMYIIEMWQFQ